MHVFLSLALSLAACDHEGPPPPPQALPGTDQGDPNARPPIDPNQMLGQGQRDSKQLAAQGPTVTLTGEVTLWQPDESRGETKQVDYVGNLRIELLSDEGGQNNQMLHSEQLQGPGPFSLTVPQDLGRVHLFAYYDAQGDGPSEDEPRASSKPFKVKDEDVAGLKLEVGPNRIDNQDEP